MDVGSVGPILSPRPLRVLHLGRFYQPDGFGGIERHVAELLGALGNRVTADNLVAADSLQGDQLNVGGYRILRAPNFGVMASTAISPAMLLWARRLHAQHPYDIVHVHFPDPLGQLVAQCLPRSVRRVVSWHSDVIRQQLLLRLYQPSMNFFLRNVDAVVAATPAHFACSTQMGAVAEDRRHVIPYGLDYARFDAPRTLARAAVLRSVVDRSGKWPVIFAVGRHVYYKGFAFLIEALTLLPGVRLVLAGRGPLSADLKMLAATCGVADRVLFPGRLDDDELAAWYRACDVFCMPSTACSEAFGLVQLEAMACGKPVVNTLLSNGVNAASQEGVTGLTAMPSDVVSLADCLRQLVHDAALRARLGAAGQVRARSVFSTKRMAEDTLMLYEQLVLR